MPRFFFDVDDGEWDIRDDVGFDLHDRHAARDHAAIVLPHIARGMFGDIVCAVRNDREKVVLIVEAAKDRQGTIVIGKAVSVLGA